MTFVLIVRLSNLYFRHEIDIGFKVCVNLVDNLISLVSMEVPLDYSTEEPVVLVTLERITHLVSFMVDRTPR